MALNLKDRVKETCTSPGTGTVTLLGPAAGYVGFSTVGTGNTTYYAIVDQSGTIKWEVGTGTWTTGGSYGTLSRDTVLSNSAGTTAKIDFSTGTQDVFVTLPSQFAVTNVSVATANGFSGTTAVTASVPSLTLKTTVNGLLNGNSTSGVISSTTIGTGLNLTSGTLNATAATASALGIVYGATGNTTSNVNNTGLGFNHIIGTGVTNSAIIGNNANITNVGTSDYTVVGGTALGYTAKTTRQNGVAIGAASTAIQPDAIAIGANTTINNPGTIVIGSQAHDLTASSYAIGIGTQSEVAGNQSIVIGYQAYTQTGNDYSIAIGTGAHTNGDSSVALGSGAATISSSVAIGNNANAYNGSVAIGATAYAVQDNSIVISATGSIGYIPNQGVFIDSFRDESAGSPNKVLKYNTTTKEIFYGAGSSGSGSVTDVSVVTANGLGGTVATSTTTPAITLSTTVTGVLKGNGTAISAAAAGTDYAPATSGSSILKGNGTGGFSSAAAGTDYAPATSGSSILKGNGTGGFSSASAGTDYAPATSGTSILYGNGTGGFSSVTVGSGLSFTAGTLAATGGGGSVTNVSVATANGFGGTVATSTTTPAITITTGVTGLLKGNGTAVSAATAGTDYAPATSGSSILYGNGTGGFSSVTIGSGVSFAAGTLSATGTGGTVTNASVVSANGFGGSVATSTSTPAITITTSVTGLLKGNGTAVSAAAAGTDYAPATSGSAILKGNGSGGFSSAAAGTDYAPATSGTSGQVLTTNGSGGFSNNANLSFSGSTLTVTGTGYSPNITLTDAAGIDWNTALGQVATFTFVSSSRTMNAPTNLVNGGFYALAVIQNGGGNTLTWNSVFKWPGGVAPILSPSASAKDYFVFRSDGTNLYLQGQSLGVA
jgi:hypothetical protein